MDITPFLKNPGLLQSNQRWGIFRGYIVDVNDVERRGRIRVHLYGLDADYNDDFPSDLMYWAEPIVNLFGSFSPPEMGMRAWIMFEAGDMESPVCIGYGYANPAGRGTMPCDSGYGSEIPAEAWDSHFGYPESTTIFKTGEGSVMWARNKLLGKRSMETEIGIEDTGGKGLIIRSFHDDHKDNTPKIELNDGNPPSLMERSPEYLDGVTITKGDVARTGWPGGATEAPGNVELQVPNLSVNLGSGKEDQTTLSIQQVEAEEDGFGYELTAMSGLVKSERVGRALEAGLEDTFMLNSPRYIIINGALLPPRRWAR